MKQSKTLAEQVLECGHPEVVGHRLRSTYKDMPKDELKALCHTLLKMYKINNDSSMASYGLIALVNEILESLK